MANEAMSEGRLKEIEADLARTWFSLSDAGVRFHEHTKALLSALREAQKRAEEAEEAGFSLDYAAHRLALSLAESDPADFSHDLTTEDIDHIVSLAVVVMAEVFP